MKEEKKKEILEEFRELLKEYKDVFLEKLLPGLLLNREENNYRIKVVPGVRLAKRNYYWLVLKEMEELKKKLEEYMKLGHIRPFTSPWRVLVLFVSKKDGIVRMCIDYRVLNKLTERDEFLLLRIDELLDTLSGAKYFLVLDLDMAYHQVRLNEEDILKTAFTCLQGHYEFMVMTFGFTNALVTF
jgi:Reverse transcriptase (RNA-dependent DNA polymerase)